jgi:hypothetical protein
MPALQGFSFDELAVPDQMPVIDIPRFRRFVCSKCGSRKVQIKSVWSERKAGSTLYSPAFEVAIGEPRP